MAGDSERVIEEAESQPFSGWDFSFLKGRYEEGKFAWNFAVEARRIFRNADSLLDLGTGGGEFLSSLSPLPKTSVATEGYKPNLRVARKRLGPFGVDVVCTFCDDNGVEQQRGALPFRDRAFDCVIDRHEAFVAYEVARVLRPGGLFATQQVGEGNNAELHRLFGRSSASGEREGAPWNLSRAVKEIESAGLRVVRTSEGRVESRFLDVGAVVYYLKAIPWEIPGFSSTKYAKELMEVHNMIERTGSFPVSTSRFYVQALRE